LGRNGAPAPAAGASTAWRRRERMWFRKGGVPPVGGRGPSL